LPSASAFQREGGSSGNDIAHRGMDAADLLERTRAWAISTVEEALDEQG
jgi:hypothetical protein